MIDGLLQQRVVVLSPEAQVDHAGSEARGLDDSLDRLALVEEAKRTRVPDA